MQLENRELEKTILSALKFNPDYYEQIAITANDFSIPEYRVTFGAVEQLILSGNRPDDLAISDLLKGTKVPASVYASLEPLPASNITYYANQLKDLSQRRSLSRLALIINDELKAGKKADVVLQIIEQHITALSDVTRNDIRELKDILMPTIEEIERRYNNKGELTGVTTSFSKLDAVTNGFQPGELIIVGARPSIGKTAFAVTMAVRQALKEIPIGFFSCEMHNIQLAFRVLAGESRINITNLSSGFMHENHFKRMMDAASRLGNMATVFVDDTPNPTLMQIYSHARRMARKGVKIIYVDYLTLVRYGNHSMQRAERVGYISKALKQLARELNLPVVGMSQVNRDAEGKEPTLAELRQSGEIEEDADVVIFLHRERVDHETETDVIVAKNRNGATTKFSLMFLPQFVRFEDRGVA